MTEQLLIIFIGGMAIIGLGATAIMMYIFLTEMYWEYKDRRKKQRKLEAEKSFRGIK